MNLQDVKWVFEDFPVDEEETSRLKEAVSRLGMKYKVIDTIDYFKGIPNVYPDSDKECVVFYGSLQIGRKILREKKWFPGVWLNLENYKCSTYYPEFYKYLFNTPYIFSNLGMVNQLMPSIESFSKEGCTFMRPDSGFKSFTGQIFDLNELDKEVKKIQGFYSCPDKELVLISPPKNIKAEWRLYVVDGKIATGSQYKEYGRLKPDSFVPALVIEFGEKVLNEVEFRPDPAFVLDICEDNDGDLWVLEINSLSCSGLYAADADKFAKSVSELALETYKMYHDSIDLTNEQ